MGRQLLLAVAVFLSALGGEARAEILRFYASEDGWVNEANPGATYGENSYLSIKDRSGGAEAFLLFTAGNASLFEGKRVTEASLWLYQYQATYSPGDTVYLHAVTQPWAERSLSWNERPQAGEVVSSLEFSSGNECWRRFDGLAQAIVSWTPGSGLGFCLENDRDAGTEELFARFYSSEAAADKRPYLEVAFAPVTATPEPLSSALFCCGGACLCALRKWRRR